MKIVEWDDDTVPTVDIDDDGNTVLEDSMLFFNLRVGDLVKHMSEVGPSLFHVVEVTPMAYHQSGLDMNHVVLKAA